ncbi:glycoside hydrolase family 127 protein [bacterium]|nr:MAG: glycoside hydrolase family 127 protein [bacterium]
MNNNWGPLGTVLKSAVLGAFGLALSANVMADSPLKRQELPFRAVTIRDSFWAPKQKIYRDKTIPHSWQYVQRDIEDNEIAAGWKNIERGEDSIWNQANLHKVLETVAYALPQEPNPELDKKLDGIIAAIAGAQQPNGYVNALMTVRHKETWVDLDGHHEGYVAGHLIEAAVAHYQATGKRSFLDVACKMADHIYQHFIVEKHEGVCGHAELELALVRLYRATGEKRYLALAKDWIERRGKPWNYSTKTPRSYFMDHLPIRQVSEVTGHAVRTMFYVTGVAEVANESGDEGLKEAARRLWLSTTQRKMYVVGSVGSQDTDEGFGPDYDLPNHGYNETCAACGLLYFAQSMFLLDGESESIDVLERTLYNALLHGMSLEGTTSYYRNPLTDSNNPRYNIWVCCPPCLSRTLLRVQNYIYAQTARDLYVNLYIGGEATAQVAGTQVLLSQQSNYPWEGNVKLQVNPQKDSQFALRLRIPGWCHKADLSVNGKPVLKPRMEKGYVVLDRRWRKGDAVEIKLAMPVERIEANPNVKEDAGLVAVQRGPIVYGAEALDNDNRLDWSVATDPQFQVQQRPDFLGGVSTISGRKADGGQFTVIPFYALANRENSSQCVWLSQTGKSTDITNWNQKLYRAITSP